MMRALPPPCICKRNPSLAPMHLRTSQCPKPDPAKQSHKARRFHFIMVIVWAFALIPTLLWWKESILWIAFMSLWANVGTHWSAYQGARAEESNNGQHTDG